VTPDDIKLNVLRAEQAGLVRSYFPNGSSVECFLDRCCYCRHNIDDPNNPKPGSLSPPYNCCEWGVSDRIYDTMATSRYGYGTSFHPPEDVVVEDLTTRCLRFTHKDDKDGHLNDPPPPDAKGQMMLGDDDIPQEKAVAAREVPA
jgi:hypothetical protein